MKVGHENGFGAVFRFITPVLVTIAICMLGWLKGDIYHLADEVLKNRDERITQITEIRALLSNHITIVEHRLSCIETKLDLLDGK